MRLDVPQELPQRRETTPDVPRPDERIVAKEAGQHPILRRLQSLAERAGQYRLNHGPSRHTNFAPPRQGREVPAHNHKVPDPREGRDPRRPQRDRIPPQTIGLQLRPEEQRSMLELGRFRVVRTADLANTIYDGKRRKLEEDLHYLREKGLVATRYINLRRDQKRRTIERVEVVTLTKSGRDLLVRQGGLHPDQKVYADLVKPREVEHDTQIYRAYLKEAERIEGNGGGNLRVQLDFELKSQVQKAIYAARKAEPERDLSEIKQQVARQFELPFVNDTIQVPDARIVYDLDRKGDQDADQGPRTGHEDIEVLTAAYHAGHLRAKAQAGFRNYASSADRATLCARVEDEHDLMLDILEL